MEFFGEVVCSGLDDARLKALLAIANLDSLCASIASVLSDSGDTGTIYCVWGEFDIRREVLRDGIRFSLPGCPNALAWTVTLDEDRDTAVIHCTIDKRQHDSDFVESIHQFVDDWAEGLASALGGRARVVR